MDQQATVRVDVSQLKDVKCSMCSNDVFEPVAKFKIIPVLYSNTGKAQLLTIQGMRCTDCGQTMSFEAALQENS
jgi:hypothetical protein